METLRNLCEWAEQVELTPSLWNELSRGDTMYHAAVEILRSRNGDALEKIERRCGSHARENESLEAPWANLRDFFRCTRVVLQNPNVLQDEIDRTSTDAWLKNTSEGSRWEEHLKLPIDGRDAYEERADRVDWMWGCIRSLSENYRSSTECVIPVAGYDEDLKTGFVANLRIELMRPGALAIYHHPCDRFASTIGLGFLGSMRSAWRLGVQYASNRENENLFEPGNLPDVRWQILNLEGPPLNEIDGRSMSGAAAWALTLMLQGKIPDPRIVVIGQVLHEKTDVEGLDAGGYVPEKTRAIVEAVRSDKLDVDTIATASSLDAELAGGAITNNSIRVVDASKA